MIVLVLTLLYINKGKRYLKTLKYYDTIPDKRKKVFRVLSILYYILTAISFFLMGELIRDYNLSNP